MPSLPSFEEMQARQADTKEYWDNFQQFQANARGDYDNAVKAAEAKVRMGTFAPQQAEGVKARAQEDLDKRLAEIQGGPTYQLLQDEYAQQRQYAQDEWDSRAPAAPYTVTPPDTRSATQIQGVEGYWTQSDTLEGSGVQPKDEQGDIIQYDAYGNRVPLGVISGGAGNEPDQYEPRADAGHPGMVWVEGGGDAGGYWDTSALDNQGVQWNPDGSIASGKPDYGTYGGGDDPQAAAPQYFWTPGIAPLPGPEPYTVTPEDTREPFTFAGSAEEYYGGLFGTGAEPNNLAAGQDFKGRKAGGSADNTSGIGVGKTYSWY